MSSRSSPCLLPGFPSDSHRGEHSAMCVSGNAWLPPGLEEFGYFHDSQTSDKPGSFYNQSRYYSGAQEEAEEFLNQKPLENSLVPPEIVTVWKNFPSLQPQQILDEEERKLDLPVVPQVAALRLNDVDQHTYSISSPLISVGYSPMQSALPCKAFDGSLNDHTFYTTEPRPLTTNFQYPMWTSNVATNTANGCLSTTVNTHGELTTVELSSWGECLSSIEIDLCREGRACITDLASEPVPPQLRDSENCPLLNHDNQKSATPDSIVASLAAVPDSSVQRCHQPEIDFKKSSQPGVSGQRIVWNTPGSALDVLQESTENTAIVSYSPVAQASSSVIESQGSPAARFICMNQYNPHSPSTINVYTQKGTWEPTEQESSVPGNNERVGWKSEEPQRPGNASNELLPVITKSAESGITKAGKIRKSAYNSRQQSGRYKASPHRNKSKDKFLIECKRRGMSYKDIKKLGQFEEAESTLRGRFRTLTKTKEQRVRKPQWQAQDVRLLHEAVQKFSPSTSLLSPPSSPSTRPHPSPGASPLSTNASSPLPEANDTPRQSKKVSWKRVAEFIWYRGGSYHFGAATCKKKWCEAQDMQGNNYNEGLI